MQLVLLVLAAAPARVGESVDLLAARSELVATVRVVSVVTEQNNAGYAPPIGQVVLAKIIRVAKGSTPARPIRIFAARYANRARVGGHYLAYLSRTESDPVRWHYGWEQEKGSWHLENPSGLIPVTADGAQTVSLRREGQALFAPDSTVEGDDAGVLERVPLASLLDTRRDGGVQAVAARCTPCRLAEVAGSFLSPDSRDCTPPTLDLGVPVIWEREQACFARGGPVHGYRTWDFSSRSDPVTRLDLRRTGEAWSVLEAQPGARACLGRVALRTCPDGGLPYDLRACDARIVCDELESLALESGRMRCTRSPESPRALACSVASGDGGPTVEDAGITLFCTTSDAGLSCVPRPSGPDYELL